VVYGIPSSLGNDGFLYGISYRILSLTEAVRAGESSEDSVGTMSQQTNLARLRGQYSSGTPSGLAMREPLTLSGPGQGS
jgi:hypothetical protein